jgi:multidrug efflux pump subunit AcrA (membrane-fusion protein)
MHNLDRILEEVALIKEQIAAAQARLAALESLLVQAAQQQAQAEQAQVQQAQQPVQQVKQVKQVPAPAPKPKPERRPKKFEFDGDAKLALAIMRLIESRGDLRISLLKWYLDLHHDIRATEREIIEVVKALERLEALKGTWAMPGRMGSRIPVRDPWADRGPEFIPVLRKLESLSKRR